LLSVVETNHQSPLTNNRIQEPSRKRGFFCFKKLLGYIPVNAIILRLCSGGFFPQLFSNMKYTLLFPLACALTLISCGKAEKKQENAAPARPAGFNVSSVEGFIAKPTALAETVTASGTLIPSEETELHPETTGRVVKINLPEGHSVRRGELLLKVFDDDLRTQLQKLETQLKQAEITEQRMGDLLKVKGVSQQEYDLAALQSQTLKSEMELVRINIGKTELRAPYDGVIGLRKISPGAYVTPTTAIATIRATSALKLDFSIPEKYSTVLRTGQNVTFTVGGSTKTYTAVVQATEQSISADTRNLQVRALVRDGRGLLPGSFAEVSLSLGNKMQALLIPNQAIIPQARNKQVILSKNGKVKFTIVKTGIRQAGMIEITDGIQAGDTVAVTGMLFLRPDAPVKFSKID
jgi:membrane fusion protein (multidrug efflux system)